MSKRSWGWLCRHIRLMHEVVPKVVAMAVKMVMTKCRIFCTSSFFMFFMYNVLCIIYEL